MIDQSPGDAARRWDVRQFSVVEPAGVGDLVIVDTDLAAGEGGVEAQHQGVRERPGLAGEITQVLHPDAGLFHDFPVHRLLGGFTGLHEAGQAGIEAFRETGGVPQQGVFTVGDQRDDARGDARVLAVIAGAAQHRQFAGVGLGLGTAAAAEAVVLAPADHLQSARRHGEVGIVQVPHQFPQGHRVQRPVRQLVVRLATHIAGFAVQQADKAVVRVAAQQKRRRAGDARCRHLVGIHAELLVVNYEQPGLLGVAGLRRGQVHGREIIIHACHAPPWRNPAPPSPARRRPARPRRSASALPCSPDSSRPR